MYIEDLCRLPPGHPPSPYSFPVPLQKGDQWGYGHFLIKTGKIVYISPALILHYILDHKYRPPDEFVAAVGQGEFLKPSDLIWVEDLEN
jgi:hypothetical protein